MRVGAALASSVLAVAASVAALPHHRKHGHDEWRALDPRLERRPVSGALRTDFGNSPCTILAESGCALVKNRPVGVECYNYYEFFPDTGQETICRKRTFGSGCLNYVYGAGMFNTDHVRHHPPSRSARASGALRDRWHHTRSCGR